MLLFIAGDGIIYSKRQFKVSHNLPYAFILTYFLNILTLIPSSKAPVV